jgi:uncharacterized membrane protein
VVLLELPDNQQRQPSVPRPRIEGLSDLVFGLALAIGALALLGQVPNNLTQVNVDIAAFGFSFLILISVWNRYTTVASVIPVETALMVRLNMVLLFLVAIEPYLFNLLTVESIALTLQRYVSSYFALDIAAMNFVLGYFTHILTVEEKKLIPRELIHRFQISRNSIFIVAAIFAFSALPIPEMWSQSFMVGGLTLRILIWILCAPFIWITRIAATNPRKSA